MPRVIYLGNLHFFLLRLLMLVPLSSQHLSINLHIWATPTSPSWAQCILTLRIRRQPQSHKWMHEGQWWAIYMSFPSLDPEVSRWPFSLFRSQCARALVLEQCECSSYALTRWWQVFMRHPRDKSSTVIVVGRLDIFGPVLWSNLIRQFLT